jgi:hypothetical protein
VTTDNSTVFPAKPQSPKYPFHLLIAPADLRHNPICPSASTTVFDQEDQAAYHVFCTVCKRWGCAYCSRNKIRQLAVRTAAAEPNRLLTLTVDPALYTGPKDAWEKTAPKVSELFKVLRTRFGSCEYLRVTEVHKSGFPHYHLLVRSGYLPQRVVSDTWASLTGAKIVDLRAVDKKWSSYWYLTKYLANLKDKAWTERHVSYTRKFFPKEVTTFEKNDSLTLRERSAIHPYRWMTDHALEITAVVLSAHHFVLSFEHEHHADHVTNWQLGIPAEPKKDAPVQRRMISEEPED